MELLALEIGYWLAIVSVAALAAMSVFAAWCWVESRFATFRTNRFGKMLIIAFGFVMTLYAGTKPDAVTVKAVTLESVEVTTTNAVVKYQLDAGASAISNRTVTIYRRCMDNMWRSVMTINSCAEGTNWITNVEGFFPDYDSDWKVIISGEENE